jgi:cell division septation protein DedD
MASDFGAQDSGFGLQPSAFESQAAPFWVAVVVGGFLRSAAPGCVARARPLGISGGSMPIRKRLPSLVFLGLATGLAVGLVAGGLCPAQAQDHSGARGPRLLRDLRDRLTGHGGPEALREAVLLPNAGVAREVMEGLSDHGGDDVVAARAALWVGHYHYGAGDAETALIWFEKAREINGGPAERSEADFWVAQCRNLLGRMQESEAGDQSHGVAAVLGRVARLDGELRVGRVESALRGYLALEADARRAGCLGPLLYRFGLAAASGAAGGDSGWPTVRSWGSACAISPEYALVQVMRPLRPPTASVDSFGDGDSTATSFVEAVVVSSADPGSIPAAVTPDGVPSEGVAGSAPGGAADGTVDRAVAGVLTGAAAGTVDAATARAAGDGAFTVQLGSFHDVERAAVEARRLQGLGLPVLVEAEDVEGVTWHRLRFGRYGTREDAEESALARCTGLGWRVVRVGP